MFDKTMFVLAANIPIKIIYKFQLFHSKHLHTKIKLMKPIKMKIKYSGSHCTTNRTQEQCIQQQTLIKNPLLLLPLFIFSYPESVY